MNSNTLPQVKENNSPSWKGFALYNVCGRTEHESHDTNILREHIFS